MTLPKFANSLAAFLAEYDAAVEERGRLVAEVPRLNEDKKRLAGSKDADAELMRALTLVNTRLEFITIRTAQIDQKLTASDALLLNEIYHVTTSSRKQIKERREALTERDVKHLVERHGFTEKDARRWSEALGQGTGGDLPISPKLAGLHKAMERAGVVIGAGGYSSIPEAARQLLNQITYIEKEAGPLV